MDFRTALGHVIRIERRTRGLRLRDLSKKAAVSLGYLSEVETARKDASSDIVAAIASGLGMPAWELIQKAVDQMRLADVAQLRRVA